MNIMIVALFTVVGLMLVLPPLHAKPLRNNKSLRHQIMSELLQRLIEEQEEVLAQEETNAESVGEEDTQKENVAESMATAKFEVATSGVTFIRWGHNKCPSVHHTHQLYEGVVAGSFYNKKGGSANYLCLPTEPDYIMSKLANSITLRDSSYLYGTEYEAPINRVVNDGAPCALCYDADDNTQVMMPALTSCPSGWTREYFGYLMGPINKADRSPKDYICVDKDQVSSRGSAGNQDGALLYHVKATCTGIHCPPYDANQVLTCVVCSR